jgi:tetratricopeptide (TPR) repeat protein
MLLACPICHKELPVEPTNSSDSSLDLTCVHCDSSLMFDRYRGELTPVNIRPAPGDGLVERAVRKPPSKEAIFHPRLSTGRDTLAAVFVIVCIIAILIGGMTLALDKRSTSIAWPKLGLKQIFKQVEATVTRFMTEQFSHVDEKKGGHLLRGKTYVQKKSYAQGLHELDKAIEVDPDDYEAHFWRGRALVKTGRDDDAIAAFETTIKLNPGYSYAYDNLGWIYLRRSDYSTSLDYLNRSLALKPENGWAYYNRGRIHFHMGQREEALQDTETACRQGFGKACQVLKRYGRETRS